MCVCVCVCVCAKLMHCHKHKHTYKHTYTLNIRLAQWQSSRLREDAGSNPAANKKTHISRADLAKSLLATVTPCEIFARFGKMIAQCKISLGISTLF